MLSLLNIFVILNKPVQVFRTPRFTLHGCTRARARLSPTALTLRIYGARLCFHATLMPHTFMGSVWRMVLHATASCSQNENQEYVLPASTALLNATNK